MSTIRERNKEKILRAASEEFADKGFAATKTSDIAAKAGLPKPNVYYYFRSKDNLYREVLESIIEPILAASTPFNPEGEPSVVLSIGHPKARAKILVIWTPVDPPCHLGVYGLSIRHLTHVHPPSHLGVSVAL